MRFKDFEVIKCEGINAKKHEYELVKWYKGDGRELCYVVAFIDYNKKEPCWEFCSVGFRFIEEYVDGLCEYIKKFFELVDVMRGENDD